MARGLIRKPSFNKVIGAYRSQWKRFWRRLFFWGYGRRGMGWWRDPRKAFYNFWYYRTSISIYRVLGYKPSRAACFLAMFIVTVSGILLAPLDGTKACFKAYKRRKARKARLERALKGVRSAKDDKKRESSAVQKPEVAQTEKKPATPKAEKQEKPKEKPATPKKPATRKQVRETVQKERTTVIRDHSFAVRLPEDESGKGKLQPEVEMSKEPDENTPKSLPKHSTDQYIRKRMMLAGTEEPAQSKLQKGTYFAIVPDSQNENAIVLMLDGERLGYMAKEDSLAFAVCLRLNRKVYGVITDIISEDSQVKYEYETWFDSMK